MDYQDGEFQRFRVTGQSGLHIGAYSFQIPSGAVVEFDGTTIRYGGQTFVQPSIRGAVQLGWLVPVEDQTAQYKPQPAGIMIRPATSVSSERGAPMTVVPMAEDEQVVSTLTSTNDKREEARKTAANVPLAAPPPVAPVAPPVAQERPTARPVVPPRSVEPAPSHPPKVAAAKPTNEDDLDLFANEDIKLDDSRSVDEAIRKLESAPLRVKKAAAPTPNPAFPTTRSGDTLEELLPDVASSGVPDKVGSSQLPPDQEPTKVEETPKEFVWDKTGPWRDRVKRAFDLYGKDRATLEKICQIESKQVAAAIQAEIARRFR